MSRFHFPRGATATDVLRMTAFALGGDMPAMPTIPKSTPADEVFAMVKKRCHAQRAIDDPLFIRAKSTRPCTGPLPGDLKPGRRRR